MASVLKQRGLQLKKQMQVLLTQSIKLSSVKNEPNILKSVYEDIVPINSTINDYIWQNLDRWPDKTAAVCAATGHGYTYAQTHRMSISFAASLRTKLKLKNDDTVAIILPNVPEYPCTMLGVLEAGCIASMMNPAYTTHELHRQLELIECKAIVTSKLSYSNVAEAIKKLKIRPAVILIDNEGLPEDVIKFAEFAEDMSIDTDCLKSVQRSKKDVAILPFSSGTTGFAKAVVLTHQSVVAMNQMINNPEIIAVDEATDSYQCAVPAVLPFFHIFGFNAVMMNLMTRGSKLITFAKFNPELFLKTVVQQRAEHLYIVPPMVVFLGKHPAVTGEHLQSVRGIISGAAPLSETDAAAVLKKNKNIYFRQGYGLTETNGGVSVGRKSDVNHATVGYMFGSCEAKIVDVNTQEALGPGKEGEIWVRGPNLMQCYYKNEVATNEVLTDGWYKTGDIGKYDQNKYLYVTDRLKELIKVKGFQVPPAELETILRTHPKIMDCAVIGVPDDVTGEAPKAFVVTQRDALTDEEVKRYVNEQLVAFKHIKEVQFVDEIPKNPAGKILRKDLKAKYC
ncbi:PREDICTED: 4-coumarate--CoA ligase 1-like [Papilio polytes]|uniref:4-coumarate--CoA ligase 1-like n=1 Tax=Papilio polytes TaxID=76194 RepID=UPI0006765164|nr:PREDICTED: 4-coumarate--CoA ligase 1-like [Papilio polytes]